MSGIALLTNKTFLMHKTTGEKWEKLVPITKYPQTGGTPDKVEVTRLEDTRKRYINGLQDSGDLTFEANYLKEDYDKLKGLETAGKLDTYRLCFGDNLGTDGCWEWTGKISVYVNEGESNGARKMTFTISDEGETPIAEVEPLTAGNMSA